MGWALITALVYADCRDPHAACEAIMRPYLDDDFPYDVILKRIASKRDIDSLVDRYKTKPHNLADLVNAIRKDKNRNGASIDDAGRLILFECSQHTLLSHGFMHECWCYGGPWHGNIKGGPALGDWTTALENRPGSEKEQDLYRSKMAFEDNSVSVQDLPDNWKSLRVIDPTGIIIERSDKWLDCKSSLARDFPDCLAVAIAHR